MPDVAPLELQDIRSANSINIPLLTELDVISFLCTGFATKSQRFPSLSLRLRDSVANPSSELKNELIPNPDSNKNG